MTTFKPCGKTTGHGESCCEGYLCSTCEQLKQSLSTVRVNTSVKTIFRVLQSKPHYSSFKPIAHYQNKDDAMKAAQSLQLHAGKYVSYHVDSVEVY